jgi:neuropeptide Y receptor type 5
MVGAFCCSWLPLHCINVLDDFEMINYANREVRVVAFAVCHLLGMVSACVNPFLYG